MFDLTTLTGVDEPSECSQKWREHILIASTDIKNDSYDEKKDESCVNTTKSPRMLKLVCTFLIIMVAILSTILGIFIHKMYQRLGMAEKTSDQFKMTITQLESDNHSVQAITRNQSERVMKLESGRVTDQALMDNISSAIAHLEMGRRSNLANINNNSAKINILEVYRDTDYATDQEHSSKITELDVARRSDRDVIDSHNHSIGMLEQNGLLNQIEIQNNSLRITTTETDIATNHATIQAHITKIASLELKGASINATLHVYDDRIKALEDAKNNILKGFTAAGRGDSHNGVLRYTKILTNEGGNFDMNTGVYTCPADGIYLVSMVIQAQLDGLINCWLHKNQIRTQLEVHLTGRAEESGSQIAVLLLNKGDTLYIGNGEETNIGDETTFTVVLLHTIN